MIDDTCIKLYSLLGHGATSKSEKAETFMTVKSFCCNLLYDTLSFFYVITYDLLY